MPELVQVNEDVYYLSDHQNYGVIKTGGGECAVVDTGMDDDSAQMILAALEAEKLKLSVIINTHSHADHYGGNNYLVKTTGCKVYAPSFEAAIMTNPSLEPFYIYGAEAPQELRQPFMMAQRSPVDMLLEEPSVVIGDKEFKVVPLPGHSPNHTGVIVDDVFFCGDSVFSPDAWNKLILIYMVNVGEMTKSIEKLSRVGAKSFVPSHVTPTGDITELADVNLTKIQDRVDDILHILQVPAQTAAILWEICKKHGLAVTTLQQYYLCMDTLKAYLSFLLGEGLVTYDFDAGRLMWRAVE